MHSVHGIIYIYILLYTVYIYIVYLIMYIYTPVECLGILIDVQYDSFSCPSWFSYRNNNHHFSNVVCTCLYMCVRHELFTKVTHTHDVHSGKLT